MLVLILIFVLFTTIVIKLVIKLDSALVSDSDIRFLCPQFGFTYLAEVPISRLGPLTDPPWTAFLDGDTRDISEQTITVARDNGSIFSGQFRGILSSYRSGYRNHEVRENYSVTALKLLDMRAQRHLVDFVLALNLKNGLRIVVRGNDIYAMFGPSWRRPMVMTYRERMTCMSAMLRMLDDDLQGAEELFGKIAGFSVGSVAFVTGITAGVLVLWAWFVMANEYSPLAVLGPLVVAGLSVVYRWIWGGSEESGLHGYLGS